MRILVFSDSHKDIINCIKTTKNIIGVNMIIHAGDHASDAMELKKLFPDIDIRFVQGNCDFSTAPQEQIIEADAKKIFLTHGHLYNVKNEHDYRTIKQKGYSLGCDLVVFGHTHIPYNENFGDIILLNPGSAKTSRTFGVIETENDRLRTAICEFNNNM